MGDLTTKLELYLPGGGATGTILPDETVDIDKINDNMRKIDAAIGAFAVTSTTRPATPYEGQLIYETDTKNTMIRVGSAWIPLGTPNAGSDAARTALYPTPVVGNRVWRTDKRYAEQYDGTSWKTDTTPITVTPMNSVTWPANAVQKLGTRIFVDVNVARASDITANLIAGNLPPGARPIAAMGPIGCVSMTSGFTPSLTTVLIDTNGDVKLQAPVAIATGSRSVYMNFSFEAAP